MTGVRFLATSLAAVGFVALTGCASSPIYNQPATDRSVVNPPRASRGNPPFYEVFGKRYYVLQSSDGYRERGIASWYGPDFHGKPTSGGEIYDMHAMTAAHKTLPIPTWVEVTNLENDRRVIVKVNDRGPFVDDRVIDLSFRAAQELDMISTGTTRVQLRALGSPAALAEPPRPVLAQNETVPSRGFSIISEARADTIGPQGLGELYVQVGAFAERDNAMTLLGRLRRSGYADSFVTQADDSRGLHRVRIGPLANASQFDRVRDNLRSLGIEGARLVVDD